MYIIYKDIGGVKTAIGIGGSESECWLKCQQLNTVYSAARGIRYSYEKYQ